MSKYHNTKTAFNGMTFDSKKEAYRYNELLLLERAGVINSLQRQVKYEIIPKSEHGRALYYIADFVYFDEDGTLHVEDVKGIKTQVYLLKKRLLAERYGLKIKET
jgi:hypothetical protein